MPAAMSEATPNLPAPAATTTPPAPGRTRAVKERRVTAKVRQAIALLESGECKTQKAACARVGITEQYLCRSLGMVHVQAFIARQRARNIQRGALRASARIADLVDAESEHVAIKAAQALLVTSGDIKGETSSGSNVSVSVGVTVQAGYVIDLSDPAGGGRIEQSLKSAKTVQEIQAKPALGTPFGGEYDDR
jgi:hypothetical protein